MRLISKLLCLAIAAGIVALLLYWFSDGYTNWEVASWFADLSFPGK